jgi:hypothetical protein
LVGGGPEEEEEEEEEEIDYPQSAWLREGKEKNCLYLLKRTAD